MNTDTLQQLINHGSDPNIMISIAEAYLRGDPLYDPVSAEAWLLKAIGTEDPLAAPRAMGLLAREILKQENVLSDGDYLDIRRRLDIADSAERDELLALLKLASDPQKRL